MKWTIYKKRNPHTWPDEGNTCVVVTKTSVGRLKITLAFLDYENGLWHDLTTGEDIYLLDHLAWTYFEQPDLEK